MGKNIIFLRQNLEGVEALKNDFIILGVFKLNPACNTSSYVEEYSVLEEANMRYHELTEKQYDRSP